MAASNDEKPSLSTIKPEDFTKATKILEDPNALRDIFENLDEDSEEMYKAMKEMRTDRDFNRVTSKMSDMESVKKSVNKLSFNEKKKIQAKAAALQKPPSERVIRGVSVVTITPSRQYKNVQFPLEFKTTPRYEGWVLEEIRKTGIYVFYNPKNTSKNRLATRLVGKSIPNELYLFKVNDDVQPIATTIDEVKKAAP